MPALLQPLPTDVSLSTAGLACQRGERLLFDGLDLEIRPGDVLWIKGANGSGKTSLLRLLAGLSEPSSGTISWRGEPVRAAGWAFKGSLVYIGHANALKDDLTALEALRFLARIRGGADGTPQLVAALQALGIADRRNAPVRTLSQGQRRRVALARLALDLTAGDEPGAWILDEPFDALDARGTVLLEGLLSAHARRGGCVVLTSHLPLSLRDPEPIVVRLDALPRATGARAAAGAAATAA